MSVARGSSSGNTAIILKFFVAFLDLLKKECMHKYVSMNFFVQVNEKFCDQFSSFFYVFIWSQTPYMQRSLSKILPLDKRVLFWDAGVVLAVSFWVDTNDVSMIVVFRVGADIDK